MPDPDGDTHEFDELDLPDDDMLPVDSPVEDNAFEDTNEAFPAGEDAETMDYAGDMPPVDTSSDLLDDTDAKATADEPDEEEAAEEEPGRKGKRRKKKAKKEKKKREKKKKEKKPREKKPKEKRPKEKKTVEGGFFERLARTSPYVVLLGLSLVAILIAVFCLLWELNRYDWEFKPKQTAMVPAVQSSLDSTSAPA